MTALPPDKSLDALRREIDAIDDAILDLLVRRFAATGEVKARKARDGSIASSPFRPAREASMLRRLIARSGSSLPPETLVRLWRVILSASTQSQAPITLHMDEALGHDLATRILLAQHFCGMKVELHKGPARALDVLRARHGDLAVIATSSDWAASFEPVAASGAQVIASLPVLAADGAPQLLVFGHAEPQASGEDETLIVAPAQSPAIGPAVWQARSGTFTLISLPGFLGDDEVLARLPAARIAGRFPRSIKVFP